MDEQLKTYWKLYEKYYSNDEILKNFTNLMDIYHPKDRGIIIDIGCGQSQYLLDFYKNSNHKLYAIDDEPIQINALKNRIEKIKSNSEINFSANSFPLTEFSELIFSGVIISNLLHFMNMEDANKFIKNVERQISKKSILLITAHSWKHNSNGDFSYFKHYFTKQDFYKLLPKRKYEYLYFEQKTALKTQKEIAFLNQWIKQVANQNKIYDESKIYKMQADYFKDSGKTENMTVVVRKR